MNEERAAEARANDGEETPPEGSEASDRLPPAPTSDTAGRSPAATGLHADAQRTRLLLEELPVATWTADTELRITSLQGSILHLLGIEPARHLGRRIQDFDSKSDGTALASHRAALRGTPSSYQIDYAGRVLDARVEPLRNGDGSVSGVVGVAFDVTERVVAERALRESEGRYRRLFDEGLTGNCVTDSRGRLLECNPTFARLFGFSTIEEALAAKVSKLVPDRETRRTISLRLTRERRIEGVEIEGTKRSGETIYLVANLAGTFTSSGDLVEVRAYLFDDTARHQAEQQFRQAQKMEAIGRLAGGVAHDFNNLITAMSGYSDLCLTSLPEDIAIRPYLEEIKKAGERAAGLARQLLAFSRLQVLRPEVLDLNGVVLETESMLGRLIGEHIQVVTELAPCLPPVKADPQQIEQVIVNLALNARDAMPRGGTLALATALKSLSPEDVECYDFPLAPGQYVSLHVCDTGPGISEEVRSRAFEPFFTTKGPGKGSGLGLSTAYGIVKQSGGFISIGNGLDGGTCVEILLPRTDEVPEEAPIRGRDPGDSLGRETLLVVEDEEPLRQLLTEILMRHGYTVLEAGNGRQAEELSEQFPGRIHLLITDVVMPDTRGPDLERKLRASRPDTRVLFVSGYPGEDTVYRGDLSQGHPFLQKPFDQATLVRRVRAILDGDE